MPRQNNKFITGNIAMDPKLEFLSSGTAKLRLRVAESDQDWDKNTKEQKEVPSTFYDVTLWGAVAERVAVWATKGLPVMVVGRIRLREFERQDGTKGSSLEVVVDHFGPDARFVDIPSVTRVPRDNNGGSGGGWGGQQANQQPAAAQGQPDPWGGQQAPAQGQPADPW